jgi:kynurenine formamidase
VGDLIVLKVEWSKRGGIVGRGILLDYLTWSRDNNRPYNPAERFGITISDLEAVAAVQGVTFRPGDILLIRSGFVEWYNNASDAAREQFVVNGSEFGGVEGSAESVKWFWDKRFAAVGGDASVFEAWPAKEERWRLHDNLIALFGMPVGEMFDLERLSEVCKENKKWSFLFTSAPLNFPGGIASPPNAICIL